MSELILVDGNSLLYRTFFALPNLITREGVPTGGVYGLTNILLKLIEDKKPDYIAFTFDLKGPTFRHLEYAQYKAQRPKAPSDLVSQISLAKELASALKIPVFEKAGYEADDCIATLTQKAIQQGIDVLILSGDLDCLQLVREGVNLLVPVKGISEIVLYDQEKVKERFGITPVQFVDYKALIGDPSDNIPRLPGIGEKTAQKLLNKYGSIKTIYEHLEDLEPKIRQTLENCREQLEQNLHLAKLVDNLDLEVNWDDLRLKEPDQEKLIALFKRLEFKTLLKRFAKPSNDNLEFQPLESLKRILGPIALALTKDFSPYLALSNAEGIWAGPLYETGVSLFPSSLPSNLLEILENEEIKKYLHDAKETRKNFRALGVDVRGVSFDLMLASYLLNSARSSHSLEQIYLERKKEPLWPEENTSSLIKAVTAAEAIYALCPVLKEDLQREDLLSLLEDLELPLSEVLLDMEEAGIKISVPIIKELAELAQERIRTLEGEIYSLVGSQFNISSPKQLSFVLFEKLQLARGKKTKAGFSTDSSVLEGLRGLHPVVEKIIEHRTLSKFKNTYLDTLPSLIRQDGRIHTNFLQTSTSTGRLSSVNPNLQNIPVRGEFGAQIRKAFQASSENFLLSADYSQIELRVLAHLSEDQNLMEVFLRDGDVHNATACHIFGVKEEGVTPEMRRVAKTVNFGVIYGMSPYGLSQAIMRPTEEAQVYIETFFNEYPGIKKFQEKLLQEAKEKGYVQTILKRRRYIPDLNSANRKLASQAERATINAPIQGSAADIIKLAMIQISREIRDRKLKSKLVLQVHDELLLDCPKEEENRIVSLVREAMSSAYPLLVPLKVDLKKGDNWFQMESLRA